VSAGIDKKKGLTKTSHVSDTVLSCRWWKDRDVRLALVGSGMMAFIFNNLDELAPIFVSAPIKQVSFVPEGLIVLNASGIQPVVRMNSRVKFHDCTILRHASMRQSHDTHAVMPFAVKAFSLTVMTFGMHTPPPLA